VYEHRNVIVEAGKITQVTESAAKVEETTIVDGRARTLIPWFFDSHVHAVNDVGGPSFPT
jgi:imidazolonepropionase-like amidohydrolase